MFRFVRMIPLMVALIVGDSAWVAAEPPLRVATFTSDVTPPVGGHPLIWLTPVATVESPLLAKGIVLDDGRHRYVLCAVDWCGLCNSSHELFRRKLADAVETDAARVAVHCVHQHTAPYTDGDAQRLLDKEPSPPKYVDFAFLDQVTDRLAAAGRAALERLEPFDRVGVGQAEVQQVASSRRIPLGDGRFAWRMSSCKDPQVRALPEGLIDPLLRTVTLARGDKPLVRLHYYATHPQSFYGDPRASTDTAGFARDRLEKEEGVFQIYFTGCAGNVAMGKYNDGSPEARDRLTERLLAGMKAAVAATHFAPADRIAWKSVPLRFPLRTDPGHRIEDNREKLKDVALDPIMRIRAATRVAFAERIDRPLDASLLVIGPASILHLPGECMVEYQLDAQQLAGDRFLAVAAYGDLGPGYVCTEKSFAEGGYEPSASRAGPETEKMLKEGIRTLLEGN